MAGQEAHAFIASTRAQSEDFVRAEFTVVQRFEDSLQRQYDGQLRSHVHALQEECREHVGQEEDKMRKELQHVLTQQSSTVETNSTSLTITSHLKCVRRSQCNDLNLIPSSSFLNSKRARSQVARSVPAA